MQSTSTAGLVIAAVAVVATAASAQAEAHRYQLDPQASHVTIHVGKAGLLSFAGHEHEVVAPALRGSVSADPDRLAEASLEVTFDAAALRVTGAGEPAGDVADVQKTMLGPECLDVARFPTIRFTSTGIEGAGNTAAESQLTIRGELTLHGVTRPISAPARVHISGDSVEASGTLAIKQTDFGIKPISKAGVVNVKDELQIHWRLVGRRH